MMFVKNTSIPGNIFVGLLLPTIALTLLAVAACGGDSPTRPQPTPQPPTPPTTPPPSPPPVQIQPARITISPSSANLTAIGQTVQLTALVFDGNDAQMPGAAVSWSSSDSGVAIVTAQGLVTAIKNGAATITARAGNVSQTAAINVAQSPSSITIEPAMVSLTAAGQTAQLTVEVLDRNGHPVAGAAIAWRSSDEAVATVTDQGLVTAVMSGSATITASVGSLTQNATITIVDLTGERAALSALYHATNGPRWKNNMHWLGDRPVTEWYGVTTDSMGRVTNLALQENGLSGKIPAELEKLENLHTLWLDGNELSGGIPAELGNLDNLVRLSLHANQLTGSIPPELGQLVDLERLFLSDNDLTGSIPRELGQLGHLEYLSLGVNNLSGNVPEELGRLTQLTFLWLNGNPLLTGPLPISFTDLEALERLYVAGTGLCAPLDDAFQVWLQQLPVKSGLFNCRLDEEDREALVLFYHATWGSSWSNSEHWLSDRPISTWYGVTTDSTGRVTQLAMQKNRLAGTIPTEISSLSHLQSLRLHDNRLSGTIPAELGQLLQMEHLDLSGNFLTGKIPPELGRLVNLERLSLGNNRLSGELREELGQLASLTHLLLNGNAQLVGPLPLTFTGLENLERLNTHGTGLCAPVVEAFQEWLRQIPSTTPLVSCSLSEEDRGVLVALYHATGGPRWRHNEHWLGDRPIEEWYGITTDAHGRVTMLTLQENGLRGVIPSELGSLGKLRTLWLYGNELSGGIPPELGNLGDLVRISLHDNQLTGDIPAELGLLSNLERLFLSRNRLTGRIPGELGQLVDLEYLSLGVNRLTGGVPEELGRLTRLTYLWLSGNAFLSGPLPHTFIDLVDLERLYVEGTGLCAPVDDAFQTWLREVPVKSGVFPCTPGP